MTMAFRKTYKIIYLLVIGLVIVAAFYFLSLHFDHSDDLTELYKANNASRLHATRKPKNPFLKEVSHICLSVDSETLVGAISTINSIVQNTQYPMAFHILVTQDAYAHLRRWIDNSGLKGIHYEAKIFDTDQLHGMIQVRLGLQDLADPMNYARFYYDQYFPDLHGNVIHIDNDCIVQGDINELYTTKINDPNIAAFSDDCSSSAKRFTFVDNSYDHYVNFNNEHVKSLKMDRYSCSFNTGVYVFNVEKWRLENVTNKIEYWMKLNTRENVYGNEKAGGGSQPPIMIALYKSYVLLDPLWNVRHLGMTLSKHYSASMIKKAKILHWSGPHKPWQQRAAVPFASVWHKYFIPDPTEKFKLT